VSYPPSSPDVPPPPPTPPTGTRSPMPLWLPVVAGMAVVAVVAVVVALVAGGGSKSGSTTTLAASTSQATTSTSSTTSSTTSTSSTTTTIAQPEAGGSWTVLVYGLADNNLEDNLLTDLGEMAAVPAADLTFVALADRTPDYTDAALPGIGNWDTAKLLTAGPAGFTEEADLGELNMGDPAVLTDFLTRAIAAHPADHYALILWNHGSIAGVGSDESSGDGLSVPEIAAGIRDGLAAAGVDRLDIIGFDACLMGAYEVAAGLADLGDYLIASEEVEPLDGWDYSAFDLLAAQPDAVTARSLGEEIVRRYVATSGPGDPTVTLSLLDLSLTDELIAALDGLRSAAVPEMASFAPTIGRTRADAPSFGGSPFPDEDFYMVDIGVFLENLSSAEAPLGEAATAALAVFDEMVIASGEGEAATAATGLAIHFPPYPEYYYENWYLGIQAPVWPDFLTAYYTAGQAIPADKRPSFAPIDNQASHYFDEWGLTVEAAFDDAAVDNIVDAILYTGIVADDGTITFIGEDQALYQGNQALGSNDLSVLILDDGEDQAIAYQDISFSEDLTVFILEVPLAYYPPGSTVEYQNVTLQLTYNVTTEEFTEGFFVIDEFGTIGDFQADPSGLIVPWMAQWRPDGTVEWVQTSGVGLWADLPNLLYDFEPLDPGTSLYAELWVFDYGGNSDYAAVETVIPAGEAPWASCTNDTWGFQVSYPGGWYVWEPSSPDLACAYFDPASMAGLTAEQAFDQAALTLEVLEGPTLTAALDYLSQNAVLQEDQQVARQTATVYQSAMGEWGFRAFVIPIGSRALVVVRWGEVDQNLIQMTDRVAESLVLSG
jgi:hypothetical protein